MSLLSLVLLVGWLGSSPAAAGERQAPQPPAASQPAPAPAAFQLSVEPRQLSVRRGSTARVTIGVKAMSGQVNRMQLSSSALYETKTAFEPPFLDASSPTGTFTITPGRAAIKGEYTVTITALAGGTSQTAAIRVEVR